VWDSKPVTTITLSVTRVQSALADFESHAVLCLAMLLACLRFSYPFGILVFFGSLSSYTRTFWRDVTLDFLPGPLGPQ
jgi:hypothetical protein